MIINQTSIVMKKIKLTLFFISASIFANAQWTGTNPITTNSRVGISTPTPDGQQEIFQSWNNGNSIVPGAPYYFGFLQKDFTITRLLGSNSQGSSNGTLVTQPLFLARAVSNTSTYNPTNPSTYTTHFIINYNGNTGIGVANPLAQLNVLNTFLVSDPNANNLFQVNSNGIVNVYNDIVVRGSTRIECRIYANGLIRAREVKVDMIDIPPDYVFDKNYALMPLKELEIFLALHKHLPGVPSASEMKEEGSLNLGEMQFKLLEKVEELTLYVLKIEKENEEMKTRLCKLENK